MSDVGNRNCIYVHGCLDGDRSGTDGQRRTTCDRGRRQGLALDIADHLKGRLGVRGPDADVGRLGNDEGVLVSDVGRVLGRRDEEVVARAILYAHVGHVRIGHVRLALRLNPQPQLSGIRQVCLGCVVAIYFKRDVGA